jgi:hypothetical protein
MAGGNARPTIVETLRSHGGPLGLNQALRE